MTSTMKYILHTFSHGLMAKTLWVAIVIAVCGSCAEGEYDFNGYTASKTARYLTSDAQTSYSFQSNASNSSFKVQSINVPWNMTGGAAWVSASPSSGNNTTATVSLSAQVNTNADALRTTVFYLNSTDDYSYSKNISVTQAAPAPSLELSVSDIHFPAGGGKQTVTVTSNATFSYSSNCPDWLTLTVNGSQLTVSATTNTEASERSATVTLKTTKSSTTLTRTITVTQQPAGGEVTETSLIDVPNTGATYTVGITADAAWTASTGQTWIDVQPASGTAGTSQMAILVSPNKSLTSRTGYVYVKIGAVQIAQIMVTQVGLSLTVSSPSLDFTADGGTYNVSILSNTDWKVTEKPEWVTLSSLQGTGNATLSATVPSYNYTTIRSGIIKIEVEGTTLCSQIDVVQQARTFDDLTETLLFKAAASSQSFDITTDGAWTARTDGQTTWLHLSPTAGTGSATVQVAVDENTGKEERTATITVAVGNKQQKVLVTQKPHYFTITPSSLAGSIPSKGGVHQISITSDVTWTASTVASWLQLSKTSGQGNIDVTISAGDNPSINPRSENVVFSPLYSQPIQLRVTQAARYLQIDCTSLQFFSKGGESQTITVTSDATYTFETSADWLTVKPNGNTFTVVAAENDGEESRDATISVIMTGLVDGEQYQVDIPVHQLGGSATISSLGFGQDANWNLCSDTHCTLTITHFQTDADWNVAGNGSLRIISVGKFTEDQNWNP